jgi:hypothetical protein
MFAKTANILQNIKENVDAEEIESKLLGKPQMRLTLLKGVATPRIASRRSREPLLPEL